jgi:hypothetical protein
MIDGSILLFKAKENFVSKSIEYITDSPYTHTAIYIGGYVFESTVWMPPGSKPWMIWKLKSGVKWNVVVPKADLILVPKAPVDVEKGIAKAAELINSRARYNFLLTLFDAFLYPTRWLWKKIYKKTGWAPFVGYSTNCSYVADEIEKAMGLDLWPDMPESLTVPGDYLYCDLLEIQT